MTGAVIRARRARLDAPGDHRDLADQTFFFAPAYDPPQARLLRPSNDLVRWVLRHQPTHLSAVADGYDPETDESSDVLFVIPCDSWRLEQDSYSQPELVGGLRAGWTITQVPAEDSAAALRLV